MKLPRTWRIRHLVFRLRARDLGTWEPVPKFYFTKVLIKDADKLSQEVLK